MAARTTDHEVIEFNKPSSIEFADNYENNIHYYHKTLGKGAGDKSLDSLLASDLGGYGNAQLVDITVNYVFTKAGAKLMVGTKGATSSATLAQIAMKENGIYAVGKEFNIGDHVTKHILSDHGVSLQIRPASSTNIMMSFCWSATEGVEGLVTFKVMTNGPEQTYGSLN
jgi:hypothetical protein